MEILTEMMLITANGIGLHSSEMSLNSPGRLDGPSFITPQGGERYVSPKIMVEISRGGDVRILKDGIWSVK